MLVMRELVYRFTVGTYRGVKTCSDQAHKTEFYFFPLSCESSPLGTALKAVVASRSCQTSAQEHV